ncbi:hypothetical protein EKK58_10390 [Candidatus Dependentiae bacterium]|nr:MAG: hypothetical protein EKK58_10390 [Candidatus Dependentiae bacterium]
MTNNKAWHKKAQELHQEGWSYRAIGRELGKDESVVRRYLNKVRAEIEIFGEALDKPVESLWDDFSFGGGVGKQKKPSSPRVLFLDIETAPIDGYVWDLWNNNVSLDQIEKDWYILSWAAKWLGEEDVFYEDKSDTWDNEDDLMLLGGIWTLMNEADIIVTQNGIKFDEKKLNARFIINGFPPPSSYRSVDTLQIAKKHFGFTSNKLEYMTSKLCKKYKKLTHGKYPGFKLWKQCLLGNQEAWTEMYEYNVHDVLALEELYLILRPWYKSHPNFNVYTDSEETVCACGNKEFEHSGYHYTNLGKYDKFKCTECFAETRGSVNLLPKSKRATLHRNIM